MLYFYIIRVVRFPWMARGISKTIPITNLSLSDSSSLGPLRLPFSSPSSSSPVNFSCSDCLWKQELWMITRTIEDICLPNAMPKPVPAFLKFQVVWPVVMSPLGTRDLSLWISISNKNVCILPIIDNHVKTFCSLY